MTFKGNQGFRGTRTGSWAESKFTNLSKFDPGDTEIDRVSSQHYQEIFVKDGMVVVMKPIHPKFILPLTEQCIRATIDSIPAEFTSGLKGVVTLGGSRKQEQVFRSIFAYGKYFNGAIWLHPYPKSFMVTNYKSLPKPHILNDYRRVGAKIEGENKHWTISFDEESLRQFYLRDVLLHEVGHHVDALSNLTKTNKKSEGYAKWFASEFGFRLRAG